MPSNKELTVSSFSDINAGSYEPGAVLTPLDGDHSPRFLRPRRSTAANETARFEPMNGWIWKQCTGNGTITTFTFDDVMPANIHVVNTAVYVANTSGAITTTVAIGKSGSTSAYHTASHFASTMAVVGAKQTVVVRAHETATATPVVTFSAGLVANAKVLIGVQYAAAPAIS